MDKKGIELLEKSPPIITETIAAAAAKTFGIPLIIVTQAVFLILLGFNLKLRLDTLRLSSSIAEKEETLTQAEELEDFFLAIQRKLNIAANVKEALCYPCAFRVLESITPALVDINDLSLQEEKLTLAADTSHGPSFALFVSNLIQEEAVERAAITSGSFSQEGKFTFSMELIFHKEKTNLRGPTSP